MQAANSMARDWSTLPDTALVSILAEVPLQKRLELSLVSTSWAAAAVVATREMCLTKGPDESHVISTLSSSYSSICSLELNACPKQLLSHIPHLPNLQELQLISTRVQLGPTHSQPGILHSVTDLTHLLLENVTLTEGLELISVLTKLKSLSLTNCSQPRFSTHAAGSHGSMEDRLAAKVSTEPAPLPGSIFLQLLQLTYLELRGGLQDASLIHISRLTKLDSLAIDFEGSSTSPAAFPGLGQLQELTFLALTDANIPVDRSTTPGLSKLTGLEMLWLYNCRSVDPSLLAPLVKLQHLDLDNTPPVGRPRGTAMLLAVLSKLQQLTHLDLCDCLLDPAAAPAAAYAALTASSRLAYLDIQSAELPLADTWQLLLPPGRPLMQLQRLHLSGVYPAAGGFSAEQLQHIVQSCPALQNLQCVVNPQAPPTALLQLTALTGLTLEGVSDEVVEEVLLKLPELQELHVLPSSSVDDVGLMRLTALTQLSQLGLHHGGCSYEFEAEYVNLAVKDGDDVVLQFDTEVRDSTFAGAAM